MSVISDSYDTLSVHSTGSSGEFLSAGPHSGEGLLNDRDTIPGGSASPNGGFAG
jgi:hypothetical protein